MSEALPEPEDAGDEAGVPPDLLDLYVAWREDHEATGVAWDDWRARLEAAQ